MLDIRHQVVYGAAILPYIDAIAALRIEVFREWPYLYDGSLAYERKYLQAYADAPDSLCILAWAGEDVVGASTACGLAHVKDARVPFDALGPDPATVYYAGESVLRAAWRGKGVGAPFYTLREEAGKRLGYAHLAFASVIRPETHPARPSSYRSLDAYWSRKGYAPLPKHVAHFSWQDVGEEAETPKPLGFWIKTLA
jgi:GNAT superfamily N-acetyltransferase